MIRCIMFSLALLVMIVGVTCQTEEESLRLAWAVRRLVADTCNASGTSLLPRLPARPGKIGPIGPPGRPGEAGRKGDPGVCTCDPAEMNSLKQTVGDLQSKIQSMETMQPVLFALDGRIPVVTGENQYGNWYVYCLLGMKSGSIPDSAITVSSMHSAAYCQITNSRLDHHGAWCAVANTLGSQWIEVDLGKIQTVSGVVTQGQGNYPATNEWITSFKVEYGVIRGSRTAITENNNSKIFSPVNFNKNTRVVTRFPQPVDARYIRIIPASYSGHISMRFDVINC